jgi:hypothetical protein
LEGFKNFAHGFSFRVSKGPLFILSAQRIREEVFWGDSSTSNESTERGEMGLFRMGGGSSFGVMRLTLGRVRLVPLRGDSESLGSRSRRTC